VHEASSKLAMAANLLIHSPRSKKALSYKRLVSASGADDDEKPLIRMFRQALPAEARFCPGHAHFVQSDVNFTALASLAQRAR
jgi:hypothetical protein